MDPVIVTADACSTLLPFVPEKEELSAAESYEGEPSGLDPVNINHIDYLPSEHTYTD